MSGPPDTTDSTPLPARRRGFKVDEDWAATILGLLLLLVVLLGLIPEGVIP